MKSYFVLVLMLSIVIIPTYAQSENRLILDDTPRVLPDDTFYGFKRFAEAIDVALTFDQGEKAVKQVKLAEERLKEIKAMSDKGKLDKIPELHDDYKKSIDVAVSISQKLTPDNKGLLIKEFVSAKLEEHPEKLGLLVSEFSKSINAQSIPSKTDVQTRDILEKIEDVASEKKTQYKPILDKTIKSNKP